MVNSKYIRELEEQNEQLRKELAEEQERGDKLQHKVWELEEELRNIETWDEDCWDEEDPFERELKKLDDAWNGRNNEKKK